MRLKAKPAERSLEQAAHELFAELKRITLEPNIDEVTLILDSSYHSCASWKNKTITIGTGSLELFIKLYYANNLSTGTYLGFLCFIEFLDSFKELENTLFHRIARNYRDQEFVTALKRSDELEFINVLESAECESQRDDFLFFMLAHEYAHLLGDGLSEEEFYHVFRMRPEIKLRMQQHFDIAVNKKSPEFFMTGTGWKYSSELHKYKEKVVHESLMDWYATYIGYQRTKFGQQDYLIGLVVVRHYHMVNLFRDTMKERIALIGLSHPRDISKVMAKSSVSLAQLRCRIFFDTFRIDYVWSDEFIRNDDTIEGYQIKEVTRDLIDLTFLDNFILQFLQNSNPDELMIKRLQKNILTSDVRGNSGYEGFYHGLPLLYYFKEIQRKQEKELADAIYDGHPDSAIDYVLNLPVRDPLLNGFN